MVNKRLGGALFTEQIHVRILNLPAHASCFYLFQSFAESLMHMKTMQGVESCLKPACWRWNRGKSYICWSNVSAKNF